MGPFTQRLTAKLGQYPRHEKSTNIDANESKHHQQIKKTTKKKTQKKQKTQKQKTPNNSTIFKMH